MVGHIDVFSVGIVLHEMLTGKKVHSGLTELEVMDAVRKADVPAPSLLKRDLPRELDEVVLKAVAPDSSRRYKTAQDFAVALEPFARAREPWRIELRHFLRGAFHSEYLEDHERWRTLQAVPEPTLTPPV